MSTKNNTIELNGKRYDARSGKLLTSEKVGPSAQQTKTTPQPIAKSNPKSGIAMDGITKRPQLRPAKQHPKTPAKQFHSRTEKSKTLMRTVVKKPTASASKTANINKHSANNLVQVNPGRASRSQEVPKSPLISRYGSPSPESIKTAKAHLEVKPAPTHEPEISLSKQIENVISPSIEHFQQAINNASSHTQKQIKKVTKRQKLSKKLHVKPKTINAVAGSLAAVLLIGFIAYQNVPNISMQVATARSGVNGSLPAYSPSGFSMARPIQYQPGKIVLSFKSNSDNRTFSVTQNSSQWNSDTLLENYVAVGKRAYQRIQNNGKTIFVFDHNATWVDGGVWYQIEGSSALNSDQLLKIAASL